MLLEPNAPYGRADEVFCVFACVFDLCVLES